MAKMNERAKLAKKAADALLHFFMDDDVAEYHRNEATEARTLHNRLTIVVSENGGPAWNASEEQWEY